MVRYTSATSAMDENRSGNMENDTRLKARKPKIKCALDLKQVRGEGKHVYHACHTPANTRENLAKWLDRFSRRYSAVSYDSYIEHRKKRARRDYS